MTGEPIRRIVIVGGGTAGWMAAAGLSKVLGGMPGLSIALVESEAIGTVGVGEATIPQITAFNDLLQIDENEFVRETHATYKLGIEFVDWWQKGKSYIHPFGSYGLDMLGVEFHHFWLRASELGEVPPLSDYSISAAAARAGKFMWPQGDGKSPLSRLGYAFQFDASLYAKFLRRLAERQAVTRVEGRIVNVVQDGESGFVTGVTLESGDIVEGDLFIDCSGFRSLLLGDALDVPFTDWSKWLPCDRAVAMPCALAGEWLPITRSTARAAGWQWRIPLQHRIGNGHVYSSGFIEADEAERVLRDNLDGEPLAEPNHLRFVAGHRERAWEKNVVALGLAGGFLEPLESTAIHLVQSAIARLMTYFPTRAFDQPVIDRYNREHAQEYVDIRDFLVLHYWANEREEEMWRYCRALTLPDSLQAKIDLYRSTGRLLREHNELFTEASWLAVMHGQGLVPQSHHPVANVFPDAELAQRMQHIAGVIDHTVGQMPTQAQFLQRNGSAIAASRR